MKYLLGLSRCIDAANRMVGKAAAWLVLAAVLISAANATTRKLFDLSSNAWLEAQWYLFSAVFLLAAGYTLLDSEHVKVDLLYSRFSRRTQLWVELAGTVIFLFPFCIITIYLSWPEVVAKFVSREASNNPGGLLLWPAWALIPVGFALLFLQGVSELIKRVAILRGFSSDPVLAADDAAAAL